MVRIGGKGMTIAHLTTIIFAILFISEVHTNSILKKIIKEYEEINK